MTHFIPPPCWALLSISRKSHAPHYQRRENNTRFSLSDLHLSSIASERLHTVCNMRYGLKCRLMKSRIKHLHCLTGWKLLPSPQGLGGGPHRGLYRLLCPPEPAAPCCDRDRRFAASRDTGIDSGRPGPRQSLSLRLSTIVCSSKQTMRVKLCIKIPPKIDTQRSAPSLTRYCFMIVLWQEASRAVSSRITLPPYERYEQRRSSHGHIWKAG